MQKLPPAPLDPQVQTLNILVDPGLLQDACRLPCKIGSIEISIRSEATRTRHEFLKCLARLH
jgi:hypothetical protein